MLNTKKRYGTRKCSYERENLCPKVNEAKGRTRDSCKEEDELEREKGERAHYTLESDEEPARHLQERRVSELSFS